MSVCRVLPAFVSSCAKHGHLVRQAVHDAGPAHKMQGPGTIFSVMLGAGTVLQPVEGAASGRSTGSHAAQSHGRDCAALSSTQWTLPAIKIRCFTIIHS
jgi:hypothetical protein